MELTTDMFSKLGEIDSSKYDHIFDVKTSAQKPEALSRTKIFSNLELLVDKYNQITQYESLDKDVVDYAVTAMEDQAYNLLETLNLLDLKDEDLKYANKLLMTFNYQLTSELKVDRGINIPAGFQVKKWIGGYYNGPLFRRHK